MQLRFTEMFHHENANSNKLSSAKSRLIDLKHKGKEILNLLYNVFVKVLQKRNNTPHYKVFDKN